MFALNVYLAVINDVWLKWYVCEIRFLRNFHVKSVEYLMWIINYKKISELILDEFFVPLH